MEEISTEINMRCFFCHSTDMFLINEDSPPQPGDMIRCVNCGRDNDYDSMKRVVDKRAEEWGNEQAEKWVQEKVKDIFKNLKF